MKTAFMLLCCVCCLNSFAAAAATDSPPLAIAIHGGAGTLTPENLTPAKRAEIETMLARAVQAGHEKLLAGASATEAVITAIVLLEDSPLFNAGVGAVYTWDETHELDASIMRGDTRNAGAVARATVIKNPILAAQAVMEASPHVMLSGEGADAFARTQELEIVPNSTFNTPARLESLQRMKAAAENKAAQNTPTDQPHKFGTVGAVALDRAGNLAAGTSTGGMTGKRWGRVGDSPIIGAGTFADNKSCAVSATGHGEYYIRYNVAADICARVRYRQTPLPQAAREVLFDVLLPAGGTGGVIAIAPDGTIAMPFNTTGMYRAAIHADGRFEVAIFKDSDKTP